MTEFDHMEGESRQGWVLYALISVFFVIAVVWATIAEVEEQVRAEGSIVTPLEVQQVQSRLSGQIVAINVKLGDRVAKGDVLFNLNEEQFDSEFKVNEIAYLSALAARTRLQAEANGASDLTFSAFLESGAPELVARERQLFERRGQALQKRVGFLRDEIKTLKLQLREAEAGARIMGEEAALVAEELALIEPLVQAGHEPQMTLLALRTRHGHALGQAELARLAVASRASEINGKSREIETLQASFRAEAATALSETVTQLEQTEARRSVLKEQIMDAAIKAPLTGTVSAVHVRTVNAVVQAGTLMVDIVPEEANLLVRAHIPPQNVDDIHIGQIARISLSAYDPSRYGVLMGRVERISANVTVIDGQPPFYAALITIDELVLTKSGEVPMVVTGMPLTVDILGKKRAIITYLITPIHKSLNTAFREM